ncbi:MAG: type IX secretion system sortase PorU [Flavobacteriales bacterium]|nr:type IX secretion system sortase PorU [Flavobacteriales bacterium]
MRPVPFHLLFFRSALFGTAVFVWPLFAWCQYIYKSTSQLASGHWYKLGVDKDGVYAVSAMDLQQWGVPIIGQAIQGIRMFGHGGGMLYERSDSTPVDDVLEIPIYIVDNNGNQLFDGDDRIFFFGKGPVRWDFDNSCLKFAHTNNIYTDTAIYFLNFGGAESGLRIPTLPPSMGPPDTVLSAYEDLILLEKDSVNLIRSGRQWFWRRFDVINQHNFSINIPQMTGKPIRLRSAVAERCLSTPGSMYVRVNGMQALLHNPPTVSSHYEGALAAQDVRCGSIPVSGNSLQIQIIKADNTCEAAWLDYLEICAERWAVKSDGEQLFVWHSGTVGKGRVDFQLSGQLNGVRVWEVTQFQGPKEIPMSGNILKTVGGPQPPRFVVFRNEDAYKPSFWGRIEPQNLHALDAPDLIILTPPDFESEARRLADFRQKHDGLQTAVVTTLQVYHEFSHGQQDISAIRNFLQMFYQRSLQGHKMPRYLLLFGDASYDYKTHLNRTYREQGSQRININTNFVPTYQTINSLSRNGSSYGSDEFFAFLKPGTGLMETGVYGAARQDIAVGRLTIDSPEEARHVVDKLIAYASSPLALRPWRNEFLFVADDMDDNWEDIFVNTSEDMSGILKSQFPVWNRSKIYLDAYRQVISSGQRYPDAQRELDLRMNLGSLFISYVGHGGETGWASERILGMNQIDALTNQYALPLYYTATCTFTRFDDPGLRSGGERLLELPTGGAIGLISTTRPTSVIGSFNQNIIRNLATYSGISDMPRLGDILAKSKNQFGGTYPLMLLFGDPSQRLAYPEHIVKATQIAVDGDPADTIMKATSLVTISGVVENRDGQLLSDFNGRVYFTQFDKPGKSSTLQNDPPAKKINFQVDRSIVFRGQGLVQNGQWSVTFKVPIDINFTLGKGRMSMYAENGFTDAHGYEEFWIGGSSDNCPNTQGPDLDVFLNDTLYMPGAVAGTHLAVYVRAEDTDGINTTGAGIGHDLVAILEGPVNKTYVLNEFFNYEPGSYTRGSAQLPLGDVPDGNYLLRVVAWDNCNNPSDAFIHFTLDNSRLVLNHLFAYPNPATDQVTFSFNHNLAGHYLKAELRIFDLQGRLIHQQSKDLLNTGYRSIDLSWNCTTGGVKVAAGVYPYTVEITDEKGRTARAGSKLVIF